MKKRIMKKENKKYLQMLLDAVFLNLHDWNKCMELTRALNQLEEEYRKGNYNSSVFKDVRMKYHKYPTPLQFKLKV